MALRTKPKTRASHHPARSNRVKVKPIRGAPGMAAHKPPALPAHRVAAHVSGTGHKPQKSAGSSNGGHASSAPEMGRSQVIELPEEGAVSIGSRAGEVPRDADVDLPSPRERSSYDADTAIKLYLREIGQVKLLTREEEVELAARIKK